MAGVGGKNEVHFNIEGQIQFKELDPQIRLFCIVNYKHEIIKLYRPASKKNLITK